MEKKRVNSCLYKNNVSNLNYGSFILCPSFRTSNFKCIVFKKKGQKKKNAFKLEKVKSCQVRPNSCWWRVPCSPKLSKNFRLGNCQRHHFQRLRFLMQTSTLWCLLLAPRTTNPVRHAKCAKLQTEKKNTFLSPFSGFSFKMKLATTINNIC